MGRLGHRRRRAKKVGAALSRHGPEHFRRSEPMPVSLFRLGGGRTIHPPRSLHACLFQFSASGRVLSRSFFQPPVPCVGRPHHPRATWRRWSHRPPRRASAGGRILVPPLSMTPAKQIVQRLDRERDLPAGRELHLTYRLAPGHAIPAILLLPGAPAPTPARCSSCGGGPRGGPRGSAPPGGRSFGGDPWAAPPPDCPADRPTPPARARSACRNLTAERSDCTVRANRFRLESNSGYSFPREGA